MQGTSDPAEFLDGFVHELPHVPLSVGEGGLQLKENACVSTLSSSPK